MLKSLMVLIFFLVAVNLPAQTSHQTREISQDSNKISVMAFNLENLFDDVSDNGETPFPQEMLNKKLQNLANSILQVGNNGPDILIVEEVENLNVLLMLTRNFLKDSGYTTVELIEGDDDRGIDVGVISKFPVSETSKLHRMPFSDVNRTRGIMEVSLKTPTDKKIKVFGVHFPSQANPTAQRRQAAEFLRELMRSAQADLVLGGGDFNITTKEETEQKLFSGVLGEFQITHLLGCKDCSGTYYYKGRWDFLDAVLVRNGTLIAESVKAPNKAAGQVNPENNSPRRFDKKTGEGVSDHLPIYTEVILQ